MKLTLISNAELEASLLAAATPDAQKMLWYTLTNKLLLQWDGRADSADAFFDAMSPGQRAMLCAAELHRGGDMESFLFYRPDLALRMPETFTTLGADEYLAVFRELESKFPGGKFPQGSAEDWLVAIEKVPLSLIRKMGAKLIKGKGMQRPLSDYVIDYIRARPAEFSQA